MLVKLCDGRLKPCTAFRTFFVRANGTFTLKNIKAGEYDFRYQDLNSCAISKSQPFTLRETQKDVPDEKASQIMPEIGFDHYSLTLYKVVNGNTDSEPIGPEDF
jgi:hypothetical protein